VVGRDVARDGQAGSLRAPHQVQRRGRGDVGQMESSARLIAEGIDQDRQSRDTACTSPAAGQPASPMTEAT